MRAHIDITEVEKRTKIRAKYLRAMENEEWDLLPGPVYVKSFLKTYADDLGLDSRLLIDEFRRRYERPSDHDLRPMSSLGRERERDRSHQRVPRGPLVPSWALVALVLVAVVVVLYLLGNSGKPAPITARTTRGHHHATPPPRHHIRHHHRARRTTVALKLTPTTATGVYVCLASATGQVLIPGTTYTLGETVPVKRGKLLYLTLGNNDVDMKVNGRTYPVAASAAAINLKVAPTGVTPFTPGQGPTCT